MMLFGVSFVFVRVNSMYDGMDRNETGEYSRPASQMHLWAVNGTLCETKGIYSDEAFQ